MDNWHSRSPCVLSAGSFFSQIGDLHKTSRDTEENQFAGLYFYLGISHSGSATFQVLLQRSPTLWSPRICRCISQHVSENTRQFELIFLDELLCLFK